MSMKRGDLVDRHGQPRVKVGMPPNQYCHWCELPFAGDAKILAPFTDGTVKRMHPECHIAALKAAEVNQRG